MSNKSVINAFLCGNSASSSNRNLRTYEGKLVSYYTVIAQRLSDGTILLNKTKYSVSTSKIQSWLYASVVGKKTKDVTNVPLGTYDLTRYVK